MIFNASENVFNENSFDTLLEEVENRFEYETMSEATAIVVGEQETNWKRFMMSVGISELASVMEGETVLYEGARLKSFLEKAALFFEKAIEKIKQLTVAFITKVKSLGADGFVKKFEKKSFAQSVNYEGYAFNHKALDNPNKFKITIEIVNDVSAEAIVNNKDSYTKENAQKEVCASAVNDDESFAAGVRKYLYGEKKSQEFKVNTQLNIIKGIKDIQTSASTSYKEATKSINDIIKNLKKQMNDAKKSKDDTSSLESAISIVLNYYKAYSNAVLTYHGQYLGALGARFSQAKAICVKAYRDSAKQEKENKKAEKKADKVNEGFINTDGFLGAVEFI